MLGRSSTRTPAYFAWGAASNCSRRAPELTQGRRLILLTASTAMHSRPLEADAAGPDVKFDVARVARSRTDPVEHSGLADRRATHRVDGGSTATVAARRWARCRAGTAVRRDRSPDRSV